MLFSNEWLTCSHNGRKDTNTTRNRTIVLPLPPPPVTSRAPGIMPFVYVRWHYERNSHVLVFVDRDDLHCLLILLCTAHVWPVRFDLLFDYLQGIPDALNKSLLRKGNRHWCFNSRRLSLWFSLGFSSDKWPLPQCQLFRAIVAPVVPCQHNITEKSRWVM